MTTSSLRARALSKDRNPGQPREEQTLRCEPPRQATEQYLGEHDPRAQAACQSLLSYCFNNGNGPMPSARRRYILCVEVPGGSIQMRSSLSK